MTDLSSLPEDVRGIVTNLMGTMLIGALSWREKRTLVDYILAVTAERDELRKRIEDAPVARQHGSAFYREDGGYDELPRVALVKVD